MLPWHTTGIYDHPEDFGLKLIAWTDSQDDGSPYRDYCSGGFNYIAVWEDKDGRLLIGNDGGCDCKTPFENTHVNQLTEFETVGELTDFVDDVWQMVPSHIVNEQASKLMTEIVFGQR